MKKTMKTQGGVSKQSPKAKRATTAPVRRQQPQQYSLIPKGLLKSLGGLAGGYLGGPAGGLAGAVAGEGISRITGFGDYSVKSNTLSTLGTSSSEVPSFVPSGMNSVRIRHREFIGDMISPGALFSANRYRINPGSPETFPWLSGFANRFQQYRVHGMVFQFKSTSSEYATGAALGAVIIATNYTPTDNAYNNKSDMENTGFCVSAKPSLSIVHAIECDPSSQTMRYKYIRDPTNPVPDANLFDWAVTTVATQGLSAGASTVIGEMWVSYDIELIRPVSMAAVATPLTASPGATALFTAAYADTVYCPFGQASSYTGGTNTQGPVIPASYFIDDANYDPFAVPQPILTINRTNNQIKFKIPGTYQLFFEVNGAGTNLVSNVNPYSGIVSVGCTTATTSLLSSTAGDKTTCVYTFNVANLSGSPSVTFTRLAAWAAGGAKANFVINRLY